MIPLIFICLNFQLSYSQAIQTSETKVSEFRGKSCDDTEYRDEWGKANWKNYGQWLSECDSLQDTYYDSVFAVDRAKKDRQDDIDSVKHYKALDPGGTQWVHDYVNSGGDRGHKWRTLANVLTDMVGSGEMKEEEFDKIMSTEIEINGKLTTIGESKAEVFKPAKTALHEYNNRNRKIRV